MLALRIELPFYVEGFILMLDSYAGSFEALTKPLSVSFFENISFFSFLSTRFELFIFIKSP